MEPCSVCREPTAAKCPYCRKNVCPSSYGWRKWCGVTHEESCSGAKAARDRTAQKVSRYEEEKTDRQSVRPARKARKKKRRR